MAIFVGGTTTGLVIEPVVAGVGRQRVEELCGERLGFRVPIQGTDLAYEHWAGVDTLTGLVVVDCGHGVLSLNDAEVRAEPDPQGGGTGGTRIGCGGGASLTPGENRHRRAETATEGPTTRVESANTEETAGLLMLKGVDCGSAAIRLRIGGYSGGWSLPPGALW